jgi:hypothetical protein
MNELNPYQPPESEPVRAEVVGPGPIIASGVLTADDAISALRAVGKWRPWLFPVLAIPIIAIFAISTVNQQLLGRNWLPTIVAAVFAVIVLWLSFSARSRMTKQWNARNENQHPVRWTFHADGLAIETIQSKHYLAWSSFTSVKLLPDQVILTQQGGTMWNFIPRRTFASDADWLAVTQMLATKLPTQ